MEQPHQFTRSLLPPLPPPPPPPPPPPSILVTYAGYPHMQYAPRPPVPPLPPLPPQPLCYSDNFQYHPLRPSSPPPLQWAVPPQSDHYLSNAYPGQPLSIPPAPFHTSPSPPYNQFFTRGCAPASQGPIPNLSSPQNTQHYSQNNQDLCNSNLVHHQGSEYPAAHNNEEDWEARARAWASSKSVAENQYLQSQFQTMEKLGENRKYHEHYSQPDEHHFREFQQHSIPALSHQQCIAPPTAQYQPFPSHLQELPSYAADMNLPCTNRDPTPFGESSGNPLRSDIAVRQTSITQPEVPSSYSSVTGAMPSLHPFSRSLYEDDPGFVHTGCPSSTLRNAVSEQTLDFAPRITQLSNHGPPGYIYPDAGAVLRPADHVAAAPPVQSWPSAITPGMSYSSMGPEVDLSMVMPSSLPAHPMSLFQRTSESNLQLQPPAPTGHPTFGFGSGSALFPATGFSVDGYDAPGFLERPKKGSMPNWLREEIIKNKAVIATSTAEHQEEGAQSADDDHGNGGRGYSQILYSSRSSEDEEEDEDYMDAARIAAVNKEIKRILTEVLLKVTDELFDEIATRVISEDNSAAEAGVAENGKARPSSPLSSKRPTSSTVLVPVKLQKPVTKTMGEGRISFEDVLGLASYASDEEAAVGDERSEVNGESIGLDVSAVHVADDDGRRRNPNLPVEEKVASEAAQFENRKREDEARGREGEKNGSEGIPKHSTSKESVDDGRRLRLFHAGSEENGSENVEKYDETNNPDKTEVKCEKRMPKQSKRGKYYSVNNRGKNSREGSTVRDSNDTADALKRKMHSRRSPSPSPIGTRRRKLSRSPNSSRHYQGRHSPPSYSSSQKAIRRRSSESMSRVHRR